MTKEAQEPEAEPAPEGESSALSIEAMLSPAQAEPVRKQALAAIEALSGTDQAAPLQVETSDPQVSPTTLQLLVSIARTADARKVAVEMDENARAALSAVEDA